MVVLGTVTGCGEEKLVSATELLTTVGGSGEARLDAPDHDTIRVPDVARLNHSGSMNEDLQVEKRIAVLGIAFLLSRAFVLFCIIDKVLLNHVHHRSSYVLNKITFQISPRSFLGM